MASLTGDRRKKTRRIRKPYTLEKDSIKTTSLRDTIRFRRGESSKLTADRR